ncbi:MAG: CaiB/BaiF CoA-transferase family protein [Novosphingobium sp.]|uniref:CaiB/BaiF CoA transferase family protein n=1 Tax=Novosphingobium sp. TaxID=1874826 RepID=UPI00301589AC
MAGALAGFRVLEFASLGPGPFCGMMLADHGAEVIVAYRPGGAPDPRDPVFRSRKLVEIDIKTPEGRAQALELAKTCEAVIEGFRPGVMERAGLGPDDLLAANPRLVYGRMTGWGQYGPLAPTAGHDINYIAISGALNTFGRAGERPVAPLNIVGDYGGGGMMLAFGIVSALLHASRTGEGQVIDCAMTDGSAALMALIWGARATWGWEDKRGVNMLDTGAHFYDTYETADGLHVSFGPIEPQFYQAALGKLGLSDDPDFAAQNDKARWPRLKKKLEEVFRTRTRDEWTAIFVGTDACFAPVLSLDEAYAHPHNVARGTFSEIEGVRQPSPAPRLSRTPAEAPRRPSTL